MNKRKNKVVDDKMDCLVASNIEKEAIYEIYRSCRLCGAGAGYKMPIIQNVVDLSNNDMELKEKIRECVQIEVHQDDKMPPLICELCVDKVQDFYEFLEMCRRTNKRTRLRLGLPEQAVVKESDTSDCILGISEPVYVKKEKTETNSKKNVKGKDVKKEADTKTKPQANKSNKVNRELRFLLDNPEPKSKSQLRTKDPPKLRGSKLDESLRDRNQKTRQTPATEPKSILKKRDERSASNNLKRTREREAQRKPEVQTKKVKIVETKPRRTRSSTPEESNTDDEALSTILLKCNVCNRRFDKAVSFGNHMRTHKTKVNSVDTKTSGKSKSFKCTKCEKSLSTRRELERHRCQNNKEKSETVGKSKKEVNNISTKAQQSKCTKRNSIKISPSVRKRLKPLQIRTARCDPLLTRHENGGYDVSDVVCPYGLDPLCKYPYQHSQRSSLLSINKMVDIGEDIASSFEIQDFTHWDSDSDHSDISIQRKVESLSTLSLKTIFSEKYLGKIPKKKRKVKTFDVLNPMDDFKLNIDSIIEHLGDDKSDKDGDIKIVNVFSQKETDYDSDRTSFNEDFDVQSKSDNFKTNLVKSNLSKLDDETSTSFGSEEKSILDNLQLNFDNDSITKENNDDSEANINVEKDKTEFNDNKNVSREDSPVINLQINENSQTDSDLSFDNNKNAQNEQELNNGDVFDTHEVSKSQHLAEKWKNNEDQTINESDSSRNEQTDKMDSVFNSVSDSICNNAEIQNCAENNEDEVISKDREEISEIANNSKEVNCNSSENINNLEGLNEEKHENSSLLDESLDENSELKDTENDSENTNLAGIISENTNDTEANCENMNMTEKFSENMNNTEEISENTNNTEKISEHMNITEKFSENTYNTEKNSEITEITEKFNENAIITEKNSNNDNIEEHLTKNGDVDFNMDDLEDVSDTELGEKLTDRHTDKDKNDSMEKITLEELLQKQNADLDSISDGDFSLDE